jgi:hypothetical protein
VTQETSTLGPTRNYSYDDASQLTGDGTSTWTFDANGNRTNSGYQTTSGNRLSTDGTWNFTYDNEGNVTQKQKSSTTETWLFSYNEANQLTKAEHKATSGGSGVHSRFCARPQPVGGRHRRRGRKDAGATSTCWRGRLR